MSIFRLPNKPRRFHLPQTYSTERRQRLAAIEQRARQELNSSVDSAVHGSETSPEDVRVRLHTAFRAPHSAFRSSPSAFRLPRSAFRSPRSAFLVLVLLILLYILLS